MAIPRSSGSRSRATLREVNPDRACRIDSGGFTLKVTRAERRITVDLVVDGDGLVGHAG
jgi:hypothetical protein